MFQVFEASLSYGLGRIMISLCGWKNTLREVKKSVRGHTVGRCPSGVLMSKASLNYLCVKWGEACAFKHLLPSALATALGQIVVMLTLLSDRQ